MYEKIYLHDLFSVNKKIISYCNGTKWEWQVFQYKLISAANILMNALGFYCMLQYLRVSKLMATNAKVKSIDTYLPKSKTTKQYRQKLEIHG